MRGDAISRHGSKLVHFWFVFPGHPIKVPNSPELSPLAADVHDNGNDDDTEACLSSCELASCGDMAIQADVEECDDGNMVDTDACTAMCTTAKCGDAAVQAGVEECDDGNMVQTDMCLNSCKTAKCGDSLVQEGVEECDDGNMVETDMCINTCKAAKCGDGKVQMNVEQCDDGNMVDNDACSNTCKLTLKKTFSAMFTLNQDGQGQCGNWNTFRGTIGVGGYTKVTLRGSLDMVGKSCNGANANTICQNLKNGTNTNIVCDGSTWVIGSCGGGIEISTTGSICNCNVGHTVRPCIGAGNPNWGGMNTATCNGPTQTLEVICE